MYGIISTLKANSQEQVYKSTTMHFLLSVVCKIVRTFFKFIT
jgi:hypothetical protein